MSSEKLEASKKPPENPPAVEPKKKQKVASECDAYSKKPVSFFVEKPVTSSEAFIDNPGFVHDGADSGSGSDSEEAPVFTAGSLFSGGGSLFGSASFDGAGKDVMGKKTEAPKSSLFVPLPAPAKPVSLFDGLQPLGQKSDTKPPSAPVAPKKEKAEQNDQPAKVSEK